MIKYILILTVFLTSCQRFEDNNNDETSWVLIKNSLNIAVLAFDYDSSSFLGGTLYSDSYTNNLGDSLALNMYYSNTTHVDGPIIFNLKTPGQGETILDWDYDSWSGLGVINTPDTLYSEASFRTHEYMIREPFYTETLFSMLNINRDDIRQEWDQKREEVWQLAKHSELTLYFSGYDYQVFTCLFKENNNYVWYLILCAVA